MRLIDADELNNRWFSTQKETCAGDCSVCIYNKHWERCGLIDEAPTIDLEKHAHWIMQDNMFIHCKTPHKCSNCGSYFSYKMQTPYKCSNCGSHFSYKMSYCGECGAKMDQNV